MKYCIYFLLFGLSSRTLASADALRCLNLAGKWSGKCFDDTSKPSTYTLTVKQDGCERVTVDNVSTNELEIGKVETFETRAAVSEGRTFVMSDTIFSWWSRNGYDLELTEHLVSYFEGFGEPPKEIQANVLLRPLDDSTLRYEFSTLIRENADTLSLNRSCFLKRIP